MNISQKIRQLSRLAILVAIIFLLSFYPLWLTTSQIPVIIGAILLGPTAGAILGFFFGLSEFIQALDGAQILTTTALNLAPVAYIFICFIPRILMGWLSGLIAAAFKKPENYSESNKKKLLSSRFFQHSVTGFVGSMLNTILYLGSFWLLASEAIASARGAELDAVGGIVLTLVVFLGIPEALISALVVPTVCKAMEIIFRRQPTPKH